MIYIDRLLVNSSQFSLRHSHLHSGGIKCSWVPEICYEVVISEVVVRYERVQMAQQTLTKRAWSERHALFPLS